MRKSISGFILSVISLFHVSLKVKVLGRKRVVPIRGAASTFLIQRGFREPSWKTSFFEKISFSEADCLLDIGTNYGSSLLEFKSAHPDGRYFGFEPNPAAISYVNELIASNDFKKCQTFAFAASDQAGPAILTMDVDDPGSAGASIVDGYHPGRPVTLRGVAMLPLDSIIPLLGSTHVRLIKIDVEGAELRTLRGMMNILQRWKPIVICEVLYQRSHEDASNIMQRNAAIFSLLNEIDYKVYQIVKFAEQYTPIILRPLKDFSIKLLDETSLHNCDYIFAADDAELPFATVD